MVEELTTIALKIEGLPDTDFVRSTAWTYIQEYGTENIFKGGSPQNANGIIVQIQIFEGGLDTVRKGEIIEALTTIIQRNTNRQVPIYIMIMELKADHWGFLGKRISLEDLLNPPTDARPI
jgi:phenylpyruvate tautomerase PptA (4-oxalocrotonate tautomerase family)